MIAIAILAAASAVGFATSSPDQGCYSHLSIISEAEIRDFGLDYFDAEMTVQGCGSSRSANVTGGFDLPTDDRHQGEASF
jgi:hypothetical protein